MLKSISIKAQLSLLLATVLWASAFVGIRAGLQDYTPGGMALLRFLIAGVCMVIVQFYLPERPRIIWRDRILLLLIGALALGVYNITLNYGELTVSSGIASFIISQSPIITALLAISFAKEKFSWQLFVGMGISVTGIGLISFSHSNNFSLDVGMIYMMVALIVGGAYSILQKPFLGKYNSFEVTSYIIWGCVLSLLYYTPDMINDVTHAANTSTMAIVYLGIFPATIAYIAWSYGLKQISASRAVSFLYFMPVIATLLGWIWLSEVPLWVELAGGVVAMIGVWVANQ